MRYKEATLRKFINKSLEIVGAGETYEQILESEKEIKGKKPKDYKPYYLKHSFQNEEQFSIWINYLKKEVEKSMGSPTEEELIREVNFLDACIGLNQNYLFSQDLKLF